MGVEFRYEDKAGSLPAEYTMPPSLAIVLESVSATFNGASAVVPFLACLAVYSQDGKLIGRFPAPQTLAAGDSAEVSFAPLGGDEGSGLHFGVNQGGFLEIDTDGPLGILLRALGGDLQLISDQSVVLRAPVMFAEPLTVSDPLVFDVRLGPLGTSSVFQVDNIGPFRVTFTIDVDAATATFALLNAAASFVINTLSGNALQITEDSTFQYNLLSGSAQFVIQDGLFNNIVLVNGDTSIALTGDQVYVQNTGAGKTVTFANSAGANVFQIQDDGSLHGLTGQSLTFDL